MWEMPQLYLLVKESRCVGSTADSYSTSTMNLCKIMVSHGRGLAAAAQKLHAKHVLCRGKYRHDFSDNGMELPFHSPTLVCSFQRFTFFYCKNTETGSYTISRKHFDHAVAILCKHTGDVFGGAGWAYTGQKELDLLRNTPSPSLPPPVLKGAYYVVPGKPSIHRAASSV